MKSYHKTVCTQISWSTPVTEVKQVLTLLSAIEHCLHTEKERSFRGTSDFAKSTAGNWFNPHGNNLFVSTQLVLVMSYGSGSQTYSAGTPLLEQRIFFAKSQYIS